MSDSAGREFDSQPEDKTSLPIKPIRVPERNNHRAFSYFVENPDKPSPSFRRAYSRLRPRSNPIFGHQLLNDSVVWSFDAPNHEFLLSEATPGNEFSGKLQILILHNQLQDKDYPQIYVTGYSQEGTLKLGNYIKQNIYDPNAELTARIQTDRDLKTIYKGKLVDFKTHSNTTS